MSETAGNIETPFEHKPDSRVQPVSTKICEGEWHLPDSPTDETDRLDLPPFYSKCEELKFETTETTPDKEAMQSCLDVSDQTMST